MPTVASFAQGSCPRVGCEGVGTGQAQATSLSQPVLMRRTPLANEPGADVVLVGYSSVPSAGRLACRLPVAALGQQGIRGFWHFHPLFWRAGTGVVSELTGHLNTAIPVVAVPAAIGKRPRFPSSRVPQRLCYKDRPGHAVIIAP